MAFFTSWQTWVKLTFVLGCAIVGHPSPVKHTFADGHEQCVVLVYAIGVRYSNKRKLKKHTIRIATEIAERGEMTQAIRRSEEVPFGIRAIERGCMVEGVWNSKATTPLQTPTSSKASSPILKGKNTLKKHKRESSLSTISRLEIPQPALLTPNSRQPGARSPSFPPENLGTLPRNQVVAGMQDLERDMSARDHRADGPGPALYHDRPATVTTYDLPPSRSGSLPGPSWPSDADELNEHSHPDDSASQLSNTHRDVPGCTKRPSHSRCPSSDTEMQPSSSKPKIMPLSKGMETLEYMNAHRRSHAAETGQLIPRMRRKAGSGDFSTGLNTSISEAGKDHPSVRSVSWPMTTSESCEGSITPSTPSLPPNLEELPIRILAKSLPLPPLRNVDSNNKNYSVGSRDHRSWCQSERQSNPASLCVRSRIATSKPCPSAWTDRVQEQFEEIQLDDQDLAKVLLTDAVLSHHNTTSRKINSGFEVLPVGTLAMSAAVKEWADASSTLADNVNEVPVTRKLQKRDRSRSRSRRSSSEHERLGNENIR